MFGRHRKKWLALARPLELSPAPGRPLRLTGLHREREVELTPTGSSACIRVRLRESSPLDLHLSSQRRVSRVQLKSLRDLQVGDPTLDDALVVQAANPAAVIRLLRDEAVAQAARTLFAGHPSALVVGNEVTVRLESPDEERARAALADACRLASAMDDALARHGAFAAQERAAARALRPAEPPSLPPVPVDPLAWVLPAFQRRRRWLGALFRVPFLSAFGLILAIRLRMLDAWWKQPALGFFCLAFLGFGISYFVYRCPACGLPIDNERRNLVFNPGNCRHCGVRLE